MFACSKYHNQSEFFHSARRRKTADDYHSYVCGGKTIFETRKSDVLVALHFGRLKG
ncbi:Uncharacterized protein APZ42_019347 [Daphnia magna]|uniref:Uncharacterized protein n=1 Tax=Daphnia magna TaxID=35525 RepID=A0A164YH34_9CRUS|nr:Uncharacterized protein APZ42_019347 [Daphnia magna]